VVTPRLKQFKPVETFDNWYKYLDVDKWPACVCTRPVNYEC
jgi:hypothetical protein